MSEATAPWWDKALERLFALRQNKTTWRAEVLGGVTTFAAMAYIIVVNPAILEHAGIPPGPSTVATILVAVVGSLMMGFFANRPIAVAPYMGENAFIAFGLASITVLGAPITWQQRLGAVFVSGVVFLFITLLRIRAWLADAISVSLKHSFAVGIGLFLAFIGLYLTGIVTSDAEGQAASVLVNSETGLVKKPATPVKIGKLDQPQVQLAILGFIVIAALLNLKVRGAILIGIATTAAAGYVLSAVGLMPGQPIVPSGVVAWPFVGDYSLAPIAFQLDVGSVLHIAFFPILLTLILMSFLDTLGTLVGVGAAGGMLDEKGNFPRVERPMLVDAAACIFASLVGTSTSGAYIESAAGVREGARTGLAAVTTALLFAACLFFIPLVQPLQHLAYAYGPALIAVGVIMMASVTKIDFEDATEAVPAFATIVMIVFSYNIANGLTAGLILHPLMKLLAGRWREIKAGSVVLAAACLVYYLFGLPH